MTIRRRPATRRGISPANFGGIALAIAMSLGLLAAHAAPAAGPGAAAITAGRTLGLAAGYAALTQLVLRARIPAVERGFGVRCLGRWHAYLGGVVVATAVTHAIMISVGYAAAGHTTVVGEFAGLLSAYPWVPEAFAALVVLTAVATISIGRARRVMRYEAWHAVHCGVYVAVLLAVGHQLAVGDGFRHLAPLRAAWLALYVLAFGSVLWFRALRPWWTSLRQDLMVADVVRETRDVVSVRISGRNLDRLHADAGQFFRWRFLTRGQWLAAHPYSLSQPPDNAGLRITVKAAGRHSSRLAALQPGTRVIAEGPCGGFTAARRRRANVLLIAGGIGITPLRSLFGVLSPRGGTIRLIYRVGSYEDVLFRDELEGLARSCGKDLALLVGHRADLGYDPLALRSLSLLVPDLSGWDIYACGPPDMVRRLRDELRNVSFDRSHLFTESFGF